MKLQAGARRQALVACSLVIALSATVISSVHCTAVGESQQAQQPTQAVAAADSVKLKEAPEAAQAKSAGPVDQAAPAKVVAGQEASSEQEASARRGRSEQPAASAAPATEKPAPAQAAPEPNKEKAAADEKKAASSKPADAKAATATGASGKSAPSANQKSQQQLSGKSGASANKKLPANLGTVTSTGSGGPAHYMSKHDAYSAIAEKHGALAQDAMRKADKRQQSQLHQRFGGIQKASGLGDIMSPFRGVTDSGLARTLGASVKSIVKGKYSVPAYVASALLGAVALMAFYESPISPLPVPALPEPPVGRFPPEMPNISPNLQVPFRQNQQQQQQGQGYGQNYQRSFQVGANSGPQAVGQPQQQQQVLFPGASAQQRQMNSAGPVQQLAANLISSVGANRQTAQRKSGPDYDPSSSRSFFGSSGKIGGGGGSSAPGKLGAPANGQQQHKSGGAASSILSFFGLGGGSSDSSSQGSSSSSSSSAAMGNFDINRAAGLGGHQIAAGGGPISSASGTEHKGSAALSNSHLVNKMKSLFDRPVAHNAWSMDHHAPNQYDQYRRMSFVQALAKDTAFLSSFLAPSRRSSNATSGMGASQLQQSINKVLAAATGGPSAQLANVQQQQQAAAARMQVDQPLHSYAAIQQQQQQLQQPIVNTKRASSGFGLMRAADRIGHALIDTFASGLLHRSSQAQADGVAARKSEEAQQQQNALASATSLLSDLMSSYNAQQGNNNQQQQQQQQQASAVKQQVAPEVGGKSQQTSESAQGRSADQSLAVSAQPEQQVGQQQQPQQKQQAAPSPAGQAEASQAEGSPATASPAAAAPQPLVRKTRSVGLDYPVEAAAPSRASQINNLVDMVSDSYKQNKLLFSFIMNQVGLSHALPYVDQFLGAPNEPKSQQV